MLLDNPCQNGGEYIQSGDSYTCNCGPTGYTGDLCDQEIGDLLQIMTGLYMTTQIIMILLLITIYSAKSDARLLCSF